MEPTADVLHEYHEQINLEPASPGLRLVNFILDLLVYYAVCFGIGILIVIATFNPETNTLQDPTHFQSTLFLINLFIIVGCYTIIEGASKGRSLGKLATGTIVVREDGSPITFRDALIRSLIRLVPFEPFSTLGGRPWHDKWSHTMVIKKNK